MMEGCRKISADIGSLSTGTCRARRALNLQREKSGTPEGEHHVKQANSLCRTSKGESRIENVKVTGKPTTIVKMSEPYH